MKKILIRISLIVIMIVFSVLFVWALYIRPINENKSIDTPFEIIIAIVLITVVYCVIAILVHYSIKFIGYLIDNF